MQFRGITDYDLRVDIVHYLHTLNPTEHPEMCMKVPRPEGGPGRVYNFVTGGEKSGSYIEGAPKAEWRKL